MLNVHVPTLLVALALLMANLALMWALFGLWLRLSTVTACAMAGCNLALAVACLCLPTPPTLSVLRSFVRTWKDGS